MLPSTLLLTTGLLSRSLAASIPALPSGPALPNDFEDDPNFEDDPGQREGWYLIDDAKPLRNCKHETYQPTNISSGMYADDCKRLVKLVPSATYIVKGGAHNDQGPFWSRMVEAGTCCFAMSRRDGSKKPIVFGSQEIQRIIKHVVKHSRIPGTDKVSLQNTHGTMSCDGKDPLFWRMENAKDDDVVHCGGWGDWEYDGE